jgi:type I restriction-modification system DNA methylase subunit
MNTGELLKIFNVTDMRNLPEAIMSVLMGDTESRDRIYKQLLYLNNYDLSYDWFQQIYEEELSQRKEKKQDFTPQVLGVIASMICGDDQRTTYEPTAGNGSMLIADWYNKMSKCYPWEFLPSMNQIECWELSDRSIPILLLNLSIRGIMGVVYHGDVLELSVKQKYILLNRHDDALAFSEIHKVSNNSKIIRV